MVRPTGVISLGAGLRDTDNASVAARSETYPEPPAADSYHFDSRHRFSRTANVLEQMDALVLLDLLGAANPTISSFYPTTGWMFDQLRDIERRLGAAGRFATLGEASWTADEKTGLGRSWFRTRDTSGRTWIGGGISDDHLPFLQRGVEILHGRFNLARLQ